MNSEPGRLVLENVGKSYDTPEGPHAVLRSVSLEVPAAETLAVVGPSGSGKSTLLNIIGSLDRPTSGSVRLGDTVITNLAGGELQKCTVPLRQLWQQIGTEIGRAADSELWVKLLQVQIVALRRFAGVTKFVVPDIRFQNEAAAIKAWGGTLVRIARQSAPTGETHASEVELHEIVDDYLVHNDGTVPELCEKLHKVLRKP